MTVQVIVRDFGFVQHVGDAVLLMNLPGISEKTAIAFAQDEANASGQAKTLTFPVNLRGNAVPGVTLGWTYIPRLDDQYATTPYWMRAISAWLHPGFGLN